MGLAEKMFSRSVARCPLRSECFKDQNETYFDSLFDKNWEVFVIKRDSERNKFGWFTLCCEHARSKSYLCGSGT